MRSLRRGRMSAHRELKARGALSMTTRSMLSGCADMEPRMMLCRRFRAPQETRDM